MRSFPPSLTGFFFLLLFAGPLVPATSAAEIAALCIGNDRYRRPEDVLDTPVADATLVAETLRRIPGVRPTDVTLLLDADREKMSAALRAFKANSRNVKLALIFFSGHGMEDTPLGEAKPETFLLPIDAEITGIDVLPDRSISVSQVLDAMKGTSAARAVILDCCRTGAPSANRALEGTSKNFGQMIADSVKRALGQADVPEGTLIAFSAGPGKKAASFLLDEDIHSPFTHFFVESMNRDGGNLLSIVTKATTETKTRTGFRQIPHTEVRGDISLIMDYTIPALSGGAGTQLVGSLPATLPVTMVPSTPTAIFPASRPPVQPVTENAQYLAVSYQGSEGLAIRDSRELGSSGNIHGHLHQQFDIPLRQIGDSVWDGSREWVPVEVKGWVAIKNKKSRFLERQDDGRWKVIWNRSNDPVYMRVGTNSETDEVCGLAYATYLEELDTDYSDPVYHYVFGRFTGWAVKRSQSQVFMKYIQP